jgi:hypothetical protein
MKWIKTSEKLPAKKGSYLIYQPTIGRSVARFYPETEFTLAQFERECTHWMYLPKPPDGHNQ